MRIKVKLSFCEKAKRIASYCTDKLAFSVLSNGSQGVSMLKVEMRGWIYFSIGNEH